MTPEEIECFPKEIESYFSDLEIRIMEDVARRIKINSEITRAADWQINRVKELGESQANIKKYIEILLANTELSISKMYEEAAKQEWVRDAALYEKLNKELIPYDKNEQLKQFVQSISDQTNKEFKNITGSLGFVKDTASGRKSEPLSQFYQNVLDSAMLDIASGAFDYNSVMKKVIKQMTNSGVRYIDYESGWTNRVQVACTRAVSTGLGQLVGKATEMTMKDLDTDYVEVSWHATARTGVGVGNHQEWQGRVYHWNRGGDPPAQGYKDFVISTGYGVNPLGLHGYNCRHSFHAFILGVSERLYTDEQLKKMNDAENKKKEYNGKSYTSYEATQYMRKQETLMKAQRQNIKLLEETNMPEDDMIAAKSKYRETMRRYADFADKMGLPQQKQRIYNDRLGKVGGGKENARIKDARERKV